MRHSPSRVASITAALLTCALLPLAADAGDPPKLKEGLWEVHMQSEEKPTEKKTDVVYRLCRNHAYDKRANDALKNLAGCTTVIKDDGGGKYSSASNCVVSGITVVSSGFTTFASKTATHSQTAAKYSPALGGKTDETMTQDQHYLGKCPANMQPGDTIGPEGLIMHH